MKQLSNKVVVITGAGSGIGRALALELHKKDVRLALNDFNGVMLEQTKNLLAQKNRVFTAVFNVADEQAMLQFAKDVHATFGQVDILINNAGVAQEALMADTISTSDYQWLLGINMWGTIFGCRAFLPYLRQQQEASIVNISSIFGIIGVPGLSSYNVSKFAVRGFSEALLLEERSQKTGVHVCCVHPGGVSTNIAKAARGADPQKMESFEKSLKMPPSKAARLIIRGFQKKKSRVLVGADAYLLFYLEKYARKLLHWGILRRYEKLK